MLADSFGLSGIVSILFCGLVRWPSLQKIAIALLEVADVVIFVIIFVNRPMID